MAATHGFLARSRWRCGGHVLATVPDALVTSTD